MQGLEPCTYPILEYETDIVVVSKEYYPFFFNRTESANSKKIVSCSRLFEIRYLGAKS